MVFTAQEQEILRQTGWYQDDSIREIAQCPKWFIDALFPVLLNSRYAARQLKELLKPISAKKGDAFVLTIIFVYKSDFSLEDISKLLSPASVDNPDGETLLDHLLGLKCEPRNLKTDLGFVISLFTPFAAESSEYASLAGRSPWSGFNQLGFSTQQLAAFLYYPVNVQLVFKPLFRLLKEPMYSGILSNSIIREAILELVNHHVSPRNQEHIRYVVDYLESPEGWHSVITNPDALHQFAKKCKDFSLVGLTLKIKALHSKRKGLVLQVERRPVRASLVSAVPVPALVAPSPAIIPNPAPTQGAKRSAASLGQQDQAEEEPAPKRAHTLPEENLMQENPRVCSQQKVEQVVAPVASPRPQINYRSLFQVRGLTYFIPDLNNDRELDPLCKTPPLVEEKRFYGPPSSP